MSEGGSELMDLVNGFHLSRTPIGALHVVLTFFLSKWPVMGTEKPPG